MISRVVAAILLFLLSPLLAIIAVMVRLVMGPKVIFSQERSGLHGATFRIFKFRTMRERRQPDEPDGARITRLGSFLRAASFDELPSLWNIVRGDMAFVGPRPLLPAYTSRYDERQRRRLDVKPGITGWVQVNGRNSLNWDKKFELDIWYVENRSALLNARILAKTVAALVFRTGIAYEGHPTMPRWEKAPKSDERPFDGKRDINDGSHSSTAGWTEEP